MNGVFILDRSVGNAAWGFAFWYCAMASCVSSFDDILAMLGYKAVGYCNIDPGSASPWHDTGVRATFGTCATMLLLAALTDKPLKVARASGCCWVCALKTLLLSLLWWRIGGLTCALGGACVWRWIEVACPECLSKSWWSLGTADWLLQNKQNCCYFDSINF